VTYNGAGIGMPKETNTGLGEIHNIYQLHKAELCAYVVKKFGFNATESEDIVHTSFEKIISMKHERLENVKNIRAFLYKTVHNAGVDYQRRQFVDKQYVDEVGAGNQKLVDRVDPCRSLSASQEIQLLAKALNKMPEKRRTLIIMSRFDGLSYAEIARRVSLSETVVRKHVTRALVDCMQALRIKGQ